MSFITFPAATYKNDCLLYDGRSYFVVNHGDFREGKGFALVEILPMKYERFRVKLLNFLYLG